MISQPMKDIYEKAAKVTLVIFDVDGVMSDGRLYYSNSQEEIKAFNVQDGLGIKMLHAAQIKTAIITGRKSDIVKKRAQELHIEYLIQGRDDKLKASLELAHSLAIPAENIAYVGDDLPDLSAIQALGFGIAVQNASSHIKSVADYQTKLAGGHGAVREVCELILDAQHKLEAIINTYRH
jgi:3-deoxy-D-manno-octulosonate 8-phosphate phosphatase (KDO 8-P phosphatase)